jgi:hypothetical protein
VLGQCARQVLGDRRHDVARPVGVQLGAQRDRAAAEVAAQPRAAAHQLVGRKLAAGAQVLEKGAAQVLLDLVAGLLDGDLGQRGDRGEVQVLRRLARRRGAGARAVEQQHGADRVVAGGDRDLDGHPARGVRRAVVHDVGDVVAQLREPLCRR